jgi:stage II sporulation protein AA (anti-sigma F factor antagonist)
MFDIRVDEDGVIRLKGRFDAAQSGKVEQILEALKASTVVDCQELDYISSAGLGVLFATQKRLTDAGHQLKLTNLSPHIQEVFGIAGFDKLFDLG